MSPARMTIRGRMVAIAASALAIVYGDFTDRLASAAPDYCYASEPTGAMIASRLGVAWAFPFVCGLCGLRVRRVARERITG